MFRLEKLQISGFKSFYDAAELTFPAAITAVVGPNGCGKSNISDALTWVLGEQRASTLRGETMEDVIFQGSERRRALSMGEVVLTLASQNGHPSADDGRVIIHRRVFRTGESEYRLNGKRVRLKDIADILMDTGLGIRNYTVMQQGKMDLILSNKPQDRRKLIEEAAGITRYKTKRRAAELKLEETQANLLRIDDTLAEVTRNLNSLKRQAAKARKHQEVIEQLSTAKRSLYAARVLQARAEEELAAAAVAAVENQESESAARLAREEASLAETRTQLAERSARANTLREEIGRLQARSERLQSFLEQSESNVRDLEQRTGSGRAQISSLESEAVEQQQLLDEKTAALQAATEERNHLRQVAEEQERARQDAGDAVRTLERSLAANRENLMRTIARGSEARNQVHQIEIAVEKCEFYLGKLNETTRKVAENVESTSGLMRRTQDAALEGERLLAEARQRLLQARDHHADLLTRRDEMRDSLKNSRDRISQTTYQIDSLRTLLTTLESQDEEIRKAVLDLLPHASSAAEAVWAAEGYETALDVLLRDITKAVVTEDTATAVEAIRRIRDRDAGKGTFITLDFQPDAAAAPAPRSFTDIILGDGPVADAVRAAVPEAFVVDDLEAALAAARRQPAATFVTREGDLVRGPLIFGGRKESARGVFSIKRQLSDLELLLSSETERATGMDAELQNLEEELRNADDARIVAEERVRQAEVELRTRSSERDRVAAELQRFNKDLEAAAEEASLYEEEKAQLLQRKLDALAELKRLEEAERATQETIHETEQSLQKARVEFEAITEVSSRARVDLEAAIGRVNAAGREHENLARIVGSLANRVRQINDEIEQLTRKREETVSAVERARAELDEALTEIRQLGEQRVTIEAELADTTQALQHLETAAVEAREQWNAHRDSLFEAERRLDRARGAFDLLREQVALDLHAGIDALADVAPPENEEARAQLEQDVARLTDQIEKIGPVNVLAIDEYQELEQRESFLRTQRDDLVQSIDSLRSTIRKINITSRELFRDAFSVINKSFEELFVVLFGGGNAAMQLLDEDDILESGIELIAQPPGKKTQSIALLSGGERALTALALLFAIFRYKPSPFCILDEVDAPLDEVNNERFVRMLREMSRDTQFVIITHSKRTMEAADVLYGVTMEEAGCSRLVSVSFEDVEL
jgi:chromosome segregation protein